MTYFGPPYPLPRSHDELERLCLKLLRRHWQLPQLERLRDSEDRELGVDLIEISGRARLSAVQCDLRDLHRTPTAAELRIAVDRVLTLAMPIGHLAIATTAWRSKALKRAVLEINRANRAAGAFYLEVLCWDDIEELLDEYPDLLTEFESSPKRQALSKTETKSRFEPLWPAIEAGADGESEPARELAEAHRLMERGHFQLGRLKLMQLRERNWKELDSDRQLSVLASLARAWLREGEDRKAAMLLIAAHSLRPDDQNACSNEILAYDLLGERERACSLAEAISVRFPDHPRARALWLNNMPERMSAAELEPMVQPELLRDAEVAMVLARRAIAGCDYARAERCARNATEAQANKSDPWLALGQAILLSEIEGSSGPAPEARMREADACFSRAVVLAQEEASVPNEVQALIARAQARIALHDIEGAGRDIENAHALERDDANGLCEYGILLRSRGNLDNAIEIFRRAVRIGGREDAEFHLAVALRERDLPGDLHESAALLLKAVNHPRSIPTGDFLFAVACAVDVFSRLERWPAAEGMLSAIPAGTIPTAAMLTMRARLELSRGSLAEASRLADAALVELRMETSADERRNLAATLHDLGRYSEALILWESLADSGGNANDTRRLLECATRLGRDEIVLEICHRLHAEGHLPEGALEFELEILERRDPAAAMNLLDAWLKEHPDDRVMQLRRSASARRLGRTQVVVADPDAMPPAREVLPSLGRVAVQLMRDARHPNEALAYAYDLLRRNPTDPDAHRAYLCALGPFGPMPTVPDFDAVNSGSAVCFVEQNSSLERWAIIEDAPEADESAGEYSPASPMARQLRGRKPGDKFQIPDSPRSARKFAIVKRIISKYAYRYQDCLEGWESRFPGLPEIEMVSGKMPALSWNEIGTAEEAPIPASRAEAIEKAASAYANATVPVHAFAERVGINDLQAMFVLAGRHDATVQCCEGSEDELDAALLAYGRTSSIVLDLTAIGTLCLLGKLNLLKTWPRRFVIGQSTLHELRRLQFDESFMRLPQGFSAALANGSGNGHVNGNGQGNGNGHVNGNGEGAPKAEIQLRDLADAIQSVCAIADGTVLATLPANRRERLIRYFGRHGAESIVLAAMPGHLLWTDDRVVANLARSEFGVRRVWTQSALMARAQTGNLEAAELATAGTKLSGWGYSFTTPAIENLMRAGAVAAWEIDAFPLKQALDQFATESVKIADAVILAAELIVQVYADAYLRAKRTSVMMRLLDRLAARPGGVEAIQALPRSLPIRFGLDLIGARELSDAIRGWMAKHAEPEEQTAAA